MRSAVTDRDLLTWIARQRLTTAAQLEDRFGVSHAGALRGLRRLAAEGLVEHHRVLHGEPGIYRATRRGLALTGQLRTPARINLYSYLHDLELSALAIELEREFGAERVVTERELRSHEATANVPRYAVLVRTAGGTRRRHFPDLCVDSDERPLAIEFERTPKSGPRLDAILRGYVLARHIAGVRYYAAGPIVVAKLEAAMKRVHTPAGFVEVRPRM